MKFFVGLIFTDCECDIVYMLRWSYACDAWLENRTDSLHNKFKKCVSFDDYPIYLLKVSDLNFNVVWVWHYWKGRIIIIYIVMFSLDNHEINSYSTNQIFRTIDQGKWKIKYNIKLENIEERQWYLHGHYVHVIYIVPFDW